MNTNSIDRFFSQIEKRWRGGLDMKRKQGTVYQWEHFTYALELHRLLPYAPNVSVFYIVRCIDRKVKGEETLNRSKHQITTDIDYLHRCQQLFGDGQWPDPTIPNTRHDCIRMHLALVNGKEKRNRYTDYRKNLASNIENDKKYSTLTMKEDDGLESSRQKQIKAVIEDFPYFTNKDMAAKYGMKEVTVIGYGSKYHLNKDKAFFHEVYRPVMKELSRRYSGASNEELVKMLDLTKDKLYEYADEFRVAGKKQLSQTEADLRKQLRECQAELEGEKRRFRVAQEYFFQTLVVIRRKFGNDAAIELRDGYRKKLQEEK